MFTFPCAPKVDAWANYVYRRAGVAVSATPNGPFKPIRALRPNGLESLDMNLFTDNGETYLIRACTKNQYLGISKLTKDLTNVEGSIVSVLKAKVGAALAVTTDFEIQPILIYISPKPRYIS